MTFVGPMKLPTFGTTLWFPQMLPVGSSEFVGRTFESFFRQIRSSEFVGRTLKVSSGKLVGSPGDPCGAHEMRHQVQVGELMRPYTRNHIGTPLSVCFLLRISFQLPTVESKTSEGCTADVRLRARGANTARPRTPSICQTWCFATRMVSDSMGRSLGQPWCFATRVVSVSTRRRPSVNRMSRQRP